MTTTMIDPRLNGPADSANGGVACGTFAAQVGGTARVRLHAPPPLGRPMPVDRPAAPPPATVTIRDGDAVVATVEPVEPFTLEPPVVPTFAEAESARRNHPFLDLRHPLSDCVVCGPQRTDGMRVTPGPLDTAPDVLATPFVPTERDADHGVVRRHAVWGALDCPSYPAALLRTGGLAFLGQMTAHVVRDVAVGEPLVVVGWTVEHGRRSHETATAVVDADFRVVASARNVWVELAGL